MKTAVYVAHRTEDRIRLRLAQRFPSEERAVQRELLLRLAQALRDARSDKIELLRVEPRPVTGSLIVEHPGMAAEQVLEALGEGHWQLVDGPEASATTVSSSVRDSVKGLDRALREATDGVADLRTLFFWSLIGLAVAQLLRGQVLAPATSLLWYAFDLMQSGPETPSVS